MISRDIDSFDIEAQANVSCRPSFSNWCNLDFFKSVVSVKEVFCPLTVKKPIWWVTTAALATGFVALEVTTGALSTVATYENVALMVLLYGVDPAVQLVNTCLAKYPAALTTETEPARVSYPHAHANDDMFVVIDLHDKNEDVAVVIPAHLAADKIEVTIRSCLKHVKPKQIFIIDNGNSEYPLDNTREIVNSISEEINYIWGHIGNKTFAQYIGAMIAEGKYKYIYTSDDDMRMPEHFSFGTELIDDNVKAVCYPITAVHPDPAQTNIITRWQRLEYRLAGLAKSAQNKHGGVLYPHGAASLWDSKVFLEALKLHDAVFFAEDVKLGMILQKLGYRMAMAGGACLETEAPTSLFGTAPNLYEQRVRSWEMGRQVYFFKFVSQLFTVAAPTRSPVDFTLFKLAEAYVVYTNIVDWFRLPLFLLMLTNADYWIRFAIMIAASNVPVLLWNYVKLPLSNRSDLQSSLLDILTFPAFKLIESAMSIGGIGRLLSIYGPNYTHKPNVLEHEKSILGSQAKLLNEISKFDNETENPPQTYKKIMYARFFQPAINMEEIGRQFDDHVYDVFLEAIVDSIPVAPVAVVATTPEAIEQQFTNSAVYCDSMSMPSAIGMGRATI